MSMPIFFIIFFFEMAVLIFASTVLLNARQCAKGTAWAAFGLMLVGALTVEWMMWAGRADVLFTSYVPLRADPLFYLGVIALRGWRARRQREDQPLGMFAVLAAVWPAELRASLARLTAGLIGQVAAGLAAAAMTVGVAAVAVRVARASDETFATGRDRVAAQLVRLNDSPPPMALVDQHGRTITLEALHGRPVLVTFAYAHCDTVCPLVVAEVLAAQARPMASIASCPPGAFRAHAMSARAMCHTLPWCTSSMRTGGSPSPSRLMSR